MSEEMGIAPIPAIMEPPEILGLATDVLVLKTSVSRAVAPKDRQVRFPVFPSHRPRAFIPYRRHYTPSE
jgi:hypothetical protein